MSAKAVTRKSTKGAMSKTHKDALAQGRREGHVVRRYLEALAEHKPKRGRRRTTDSIGKRLKVIALELETADPLTQLHLLQERKDLEHERGTMDRRNEIPELEKDFVKVAKGYGDRRGIEYSTWRAMGIEASVLKAAGIARTRRS
ncbi:MAG: hypothetical protein NT160_08220 [Actinobacteria bacterium]|nr:hypothetical protein [Actinomycetota bacterium]